jgi:hypothetical protein
MFRQVFDVGHGIPRGALVLGLAAAICLGGCSSAKHRDWSLRRKSSKYWLELALEARQPDERRAGVNGLANSREATTDWAIKVFDTIARTDTDVMVRCAAVRALSASAGADSVPTLLKLLESGRGRVPGVRRAPGPVRWEAAKLLLTIVDSQSYDETQRQQIVDTLLERLAWDDDRNVRLTAIDALAYFAQRPIPTALIGVMEEDDFTAKHAAEEALIALTGKTHHHDPIAWREWLGATDDPFAGAGTAPPDLLQVKRAPRWEWPWD